MNGPIVLDLKLKDEGQSPISFGLSKINTYIVELYWKSKHDLDAHAIMLEGGSHKNDLDNILSTYNPHLVLVENPSINHHPSGRKAFRNVSGSLEHTGDARTGVQIDAEAPDEVLKIHVDKWKKSSEKIAFFNSIHPPSTAKFNEVSEAKIVIKEEGGKTLLIANLSTDFGQYDIVQFGSLLRLPSGEVQFDPASVGLNGNFNDIIAATF